MKDANAMDGVVGVTQRAIPVEEDFKYEFDISSTQAGTFWYAQTLPDFRGSNTDEFSGTIPTQHFSEAMVSTEVW
jgi:cytochrome c2